MILKIIFKKYFKKQSLLKKYKEKNFKKQLLLHTQTPFNRICIVNKFFKR